MVEPSWLGVHEPHRVICAEGHEIRPRPLDTRDGSTGCRICSGHDPETAADQFRSRVAALGGRVVEPTWLGALKGHRIICAGGHERIVRPANIQSGQGLCRVCVGLDPLHRRDGMGRYEDFRARCADLGGTLLESSYLGTARPHRAICANGHKCYPSPAVVLRGGGMCKACSGSDTEVAKAAFLDAVAQRGGAVIDDLAVAWAGTARCYRIRCTLGHISNTSPATVTRYGRICRVCSRGSGPDESRAKFYRKVAEQGGRVVDEPWLGCKARHRVICSEGHECLALPMSVIAGRGICRECSNRIWDTFYLVRDSRRHRVKLGITSRGKRDRIYAHRANGYTEVLTFLDTLSDADLLERFVLDRLALEGITPVHGREYFDESALPVILSLVDGWPSVVERRLRPA